MVFTRSPWRVLVALGFATLLLATSFVASAQASPTSGGSCARAGRERVTTVGTLRCVAMSSGRTRWRLISPPSSPTTPTTTPPTTPTTRAPQVSDISADDSRVRFTLSAMSPDTGNYAVQWIELGASFARYDMVRVTSRNVALSTDVLRCDRTYTMRVFVMRADWTGDRGHTNENVTPHSNLFDVTMRHSCGGSATPVADTCADGGACVVGDIGPGGGTVFYVHPSGTFSCGVALSSTCKYLEFAPYGWNGGGDDPGIDWCNVGTDLDIDESGIGGGLANTTKADDTCTSGAIQTVASYTNNGFDDWYLPTKSEVDELCKYARQQTTGDRSVGCASTGSVRTGFVSAHYWSSTEVSGTTNAWSSEFGFGNQLASNKRPGNLKVRPIRAFGGAAGCADGGECIVGDTGPGGGIIFYVHPSGTFTSTGSDCGTNCKYLEAARSDQSAGVAWCSDTTTARAVTSQPIGSGMSNTTTAYTTCSSGAIQVAADYSNYGKTDWHLPSADELNELYLQRVAVGGFASAFYWNSSEFSATHARVQSFADGSTGDANKVDLRPVRVVRAVIAPA
jgi:hypothetical protein